MVMRYDCCIGNFDGVHRGHQKLVAETVRQARMHGMIPAAITFDPHPQTVLNKADFPLLTTLDQKKELLYGFGIEEIIIFPFDEVIANMNANDFVQFVLNEMEIHKLLCGQDFRYGNKAEGKATDLLESEKRRFDVEIVEDLIIEEKKLSSSLIRELIQQGSIAQAVECLGHPYEIESKANLLPPEGRYLVEQSGEKKEIRFTGKSRIRKMSFIREL
ncbi:MAG: FAD synthetase family protein [Erysipelotrichaceae bacterium]|nr:FAD synthetase family protein [Erysipelotrichaceae bacterium]